MTQLAQEQQQATQPITQPAAQPELSTAQKFQAIQDALGQPAQAQQAPEDLEAAQQAAMQTQVARVSLRQNFDDALRQVQKEIPEMTEDQLAETILESGIDIRQPLNWQALAKSMSSSTRKSDEVSIESEKERQKELHTEGAGGTSDSDQPPVRTVAEGVARLKTMF